MSGKMSDSLYNLNHGRLSAKQLGSLQSHVADQVHVTEGLTGRLTQANESEGGTDQEFGLDELGNQ